MLVASGWYFIHGLLHDFFVIKNHKGGYDRALLRLLTDGHVLLLSGVPVFISWRLLQGEQAPAEAFAVSAATAVFMLIYCGMIYPCLKSIGTICISFMLLLTCIPAG